MVQKGVGAPGPGHQSGGRVQQIVAHHRPVCQCGAVVVAVLASSQTDLAETVPRVTPIQGIHKRILRLVSDTLLTTFLLLERHQADVGGPGQCERRPVDHQDPEKQDRPGVGDGLYGDAGRTVPGGARDLRDSAEYKVSGGPAVRVESHCNGPGQHDPHPGHAQANLESSSGYPHGIQSPL